MMVAFSCLSHASISGHTLNSIVRYSAGKRCLIMRHRVGTVVFALVLLLLIGRLCLPSVVVWYVNRTLNRLPEYNGSIQGAHLALFRGAYALDGIRIKKRGGKVDLPLFEAATMNLSIDWKGLLEGKFVGQIEVDKGSLNFVNGRTPEEEQLSVRKEWLEVVKNLFPLRLNHFSLNRFQIRYHDPHSAPPVDVRLRSVRVEGRNFSNTRRPAEGRQASVRGLGMLQQRVPLIVRADIAPSHARPTFRLDASIERLPLDSLNSVFKAYGNFDVERGTGDFYLWLEAKDGEFKGTLKPLIHDVKVFTPGQEHESTLSELWESLVGAAATVLENKTEAQVGSVIPLRGDEQTLRTSTWTAVVEMIRNAFFDALKPGITSEEKEMK